MDLELAIFNEHERTRQSISHDLGKICDKLQAHIWCSSNLNDKLIKELHDEFDKLNATYLKYINITLRRAEYAFYILLAWLGLLAYWVANSLNSTH